MQFLVLNSKYYVLLNFSDWKLALNDDIISESVLFTAVWSLPVHKKGKIIPLQAWTDPEGSRRLTPCTYLPIYSTYLIVMQFISTENFTHLQFLIVCTSQCLRVFAVFEVLLLYTEQNKYQTCFCFKDMYINICVIEF